ncbi:MAG: ferrous iron transport protein A [Bacteroidota bacterium]
MKKLVDLKLGESCEIVEFSDQHLSLKFVEMGCLPGEKITLEKFAPLGCPLIFIVGNQKISMRKSEAEKIIVK